MSLDFISGIVCLITSSCLLAYCSIAAVFSAERVGTNLFMKTSLFTRVVTISSTSSSLYAPLDKSSSVLIADATVLVISLLILSSDVSSVSSASISFSYSDDVSPITSSTLKILSSFSFFFGWEGLGAVAFFVEVAGAALGALAFTGDPVRRFDNESMSSYLSSALDASRLISSSSSSSDTFKHVIFLS